MSRHLVQIASFAVGAVILLVIMTQIIDDRKVPSPEAPATASSTAGFTYLYAPKGVISAEVADTEASREQGLSGRAPLPADAGMLFVFDTPGQYGFWMKDMDFSLDLVWIGADKTVVDVTKNVASSTYPSIFMPQAPVLYVLEMDAGSSDAFGLVKGASVRFDLPED